MEPKGDHNTKQAHPLYGLRPWGRHSLVLLIAGSAYLAIGLAYLLTPDNTVRNQSLIVAQQWFGLTFWYWVFIIIGIMTMISSRWPPTADRLGYTALTSLSAGWGAFYAMGVIIGQSPVQNITGAFVWWLVGFMWWAIGGLRNPPPRIIVEVVEVTVDAG